MSFVRPRSLVVVSALAASLAGVLLAGPAGAAGDTRQPAPRLSGLKASVAQGGRVDLVASSLTASELARLRPEYERLKPRVHTNAD